MEGYQWGGGRGEWEEKVQGIRSIIGRHKLKREQHIDREEGDKGEENNEDNCSSIINKIYFKKYLGINLTKEVKDLYLESYKTLTMNKIHINGNIYCAHEN